MVKHLPSLFISPPLNLRIIKPVSSSPAAADLIWSDLIGCLSPASVWFHDLNLIQHFVLTQLFFCLFKILLFVFTSPTNHSCVLCLCLVCSKDADVCCRRRRRHLADSDSGSAQSFPQPGRVLCSRLGNQPRAEAERQHRGGAEEEAAAHHLHPHRRPGRSLKHFF